MLSQRRCRGRLRYVFANWRALKPPNKVRIMSRSTSFVPFFLFSVALRDGNLRLTGPSGEHRCHCQQHYTLLGEALLYRCVIFWYCPHFPRSFPKVMLILHIRLTVQSDCLLISYFMHLIKGTSLGNIPNAITLFFWGNVSDFIRTLLLWLQTRKKCFMIVVYSY